MVELHAVVHAVPHAPEQLLRDLHEGVRVVSGDLEGVLARLQQPGPVLVVFLARLGRDHGAHRARAQHARHDGAAVGKIRADAGGALAAQDAAQDARHAPRLVVRRRGVEHASAG